MPALSLLPGHRPPKVMQIASERRRGGTAGRSAMALPQGFPQFLGMPASLSNEGASAGVTSTAALLSAFTGRAVRGGLAMTDEITLSGHVLPVGGTREKVLAAHPCGLARVILPAAMSTGPDRVPCREQLRLRWHR